MTATVQAAPDVTLAVVAAMAGHLLADLRVGDPALGAMLSDGSATSLQARLPDLFAALDVAVPDAAQRKHVIETVLALAEAVQIQRQTIRELTTPTGSVEFATNCD